MKTTRTFVRMTGGAALSLLVPGIGLADATVSPASVPVGATVALTATNCAPATGTVRFRVSGPDTDRNLRATTATDSGSTVELRTTELAPGTYTVSVTCGDGTPAGVTTLTVTQTDDQAEGLGGGVLAVAGGVALLAHTLGGVVILARRRRHATHAARL